MKKTFVTVLLALCLLTLPAFAATANNQQNTADALNSLGLFLGTGNGYELDKQLMRSDGITLLVRLIGKDSEAKNDKYTHPFNDVDAWLKPYVSYAYTTGMTKGVEDGRSYGSNMDMDSRQFLTMVLRTLGYTDSGANADFTWDKPYELAKKVGLINSAATDDTFTRGEAVEIFWKALDATSKGTSTKFVKTLIADGAFTQSAYDAAAKIQKNGKSTPSGGGSVGGGSSSGASSSGGSTSSRYPEQAADMSYEDYMDLTGEEQGAFQKLFKDTGTFFEWLSEVMEEYDDNDAEIGDGGTIDLDAIT